MKCNRGEYIEILGDRYYPCVSGWVDFENTPARNCTLEEALKSKEFKRFKESIEDGSYRLCNGKCPKIVRAREERDPLEPGSCNFVAKKLNVGIDGSCLLACKSCRGGKRYTEPYELVQNRLKRFTEGGMKSQTASITFSSCGDPIFSKSIREWLQSFRKEDYPKLKEIQLRTNAQLFNEKFWNSLGDAKELIHFLWISIDAATKETYESLRTFASWDRLWKNLDFIGTLEQIKHIEFSFVVQKKNANEIVDFYNQMKAWGERNGKSVSFYFQQASHWPEVSQEMFDQEIDLFQDEEAWKEATKQLKQLRGKVLMNVPFYRNLNVKPTKLI